MADGTSISGGSTDERPTEGSPALPSHRGLGLEFALSAVPLAEALIESSPDGLLLVDASGVITLANPSAAALFGYPVEALTGMPVDRLVPAEQRGRHAQFRADYSASPVSRPMGSGLHLLAEHADGSLFPVEISLSPVTLDDDRQTIATVRDISERQDERARVALMKERERIARDLHDTVIQQLFAAGMTLEAIAGSPGAADTELRLHEVAAQLDDTITEIRGSIFRLGRMTAEVPLSDRIAGLVDERRDQLGFEPELVLDERVDDQSDGLAEHLLATLSEALSNVARHAAATAASIVIRCSDRMTELIVTDDGVGPPSAPTPGGGLINMADRATELGGTCRVGPARPRGTEVVWSVPIGL